MTWVILTVSLLPSLSRAETPLQAWERIERVRQGQGPEDAMPMVREALGKYSDYLPLWNQYARIRASIEGLNGTRTLRDSLRAHRTSSQARVVESFLAAEQGHFAAAIDTLALVSPPPTASTEEVLRSLTLAALGVGARQLDRADSQLALIRSNRKTITTDRVVHTYVQLTEEQLDAVLLLHRGSHDEALRRLEALAKRATSLNFLDLAMRVQHLRARTLSSLSRYAESLPVYDSELELARTLQDRWQIAAAMAWKAWALERLYRHEPALELRKLCVQEFPQLGDTLGTCYSLLGLGWDAMQVGDLTTAEKVLRRAQSFGRRRGWKWMESQACNNLGALYMNAGRFDLALETFERGRELASEENDSSRMRSVLNNMAILDMERGRPDQALEIYEKLLVLHRQSQDAIGQLTVLNNMALACEQMGQDAQARVMYEQSLALAEARALNNNVARINLGQNASAHGQLEEGERTLRAAIVDADERGDARQLAAAHAQLGVCLSREGRNEEALYHLREADRLRRNAGIVVERVPDLLQLARVQIKLGRNSEALATLDRAEPLVTSLATGFEASLHAKRARAFLRSGMADSARTYAHRAVMAASNSWAGKSANSRSSQQIAAGRALRVMLESSKGTGDEKSRLITREAFELLQGVQSHSLLEYVQGGQRPIQPDVPDSLLQQERAARVSVDRLQRRLASDLGSTEATDSLQLALAEAQARQEGLRTKIFHLDERYRESARAVKMDPAELDRLLRPGTLILDYLCARGCESEDPCSLLLFAADSLGVEAYTLGRTPEIARQIDLLSDLLAGPPRAEDDEAIELLLNGLGRALLAPVADRIGRYDSVIVVPDGVLSRLPFAALRIPRMEDPSQRSYVLEETTIETVPSLAVLAQLRRAQRRESSTRARWDIAIWHGRLGDQQAPEMHGGASLQLPHAKDELNELKRRFARTTVLRVSPKVLAQGNLVHSNLVSSGSSKVLHFIAHGYFDSRQPWRSGLYFSGGPDREDVQKLEIADIYRMKPRCSLVTLSACETARGAVDEGVGFLGLTQALFGSGVPSVLATLWPIDDASAPTFISTFYEQLAAGSSKAEALRQAQLQFLHDEGLSSPFYWAPYVLVGDGSGKVELTLRRSTPLASPKSTLALGSLLLLAAVWLWGRRRRSRRS